MSWGLCLCWADENLSSPTDLKPHSGTERQEDSCPAGADALCGRGAQSGRRAGPDRPPQQFVHPDCPLQEAIFFLLVAAVRETTVWPRVVKTNCHVNLLVRAPAARASSNNKFLKGCLLNVIRVYSFFVQMLKLYFQGRSDISLISYFCRKILFYVVDVSLRQFHSLHILKWLSLFLNSKQKNKVFVDFEYSNFLYTF